MLTLTRLSDNLLKLEHQTGLKNWADELRKLAKANEALHVVLTKKSELNLNNKNVFPQVRIREDTYFYTVWKEVYIRVVWLGVLKVWIKIQKRVEKGNKMGRAEAIQTGVVDFQRYHCLSV